MNLLNKFEKKDKMQGLPSILSLFCNEFYKFNNTGAQKLDSIYNITLKLLHFFGVETLSFLHSVCKVVFDFIT